MKSPGWGSGYISVRTRAWGSSLLSRLRLRAWTGLFPQAPWFSYWAGQDGTARFTTVEAEVVLMVPFLFFRCEALTSQIGLHGFGGQYTKFGGHGTQVGWAAGDLFSPLFVLRADYLCGW